MGPRINYNPPREEDVKRPDPHYGRGPAKAGKLDTIYSEHAVYSERVSQRRQTPGWKPHTMKAPMLILFILTSLILAAVIEFLAQKSLREGGLSLSTDADPTVAVVLYSRYAPTIIAVIYSLWWTWIDLDIRRMQPWLELSRDGGASAESTLLLDYPFEFLAFIPFKASKKKHWLVFLAGTVMMLIFWAITPLQSAIFGTQAVALVDEVSMVDTARLANLSQQVDTIDASILNDAYAITWLGQPYPKFTTPRHAFLPLQPITKGNSFLPSETWATTATALTTDLDCWPATVKKTELQDTYEFDSNQGCKANISFYGDTRADINSSSVGYTILYIGHPPEAHQDWYLSGPDCGREASHQFLATWGRRPNNSDIEAVTGIFCEPSYTKQQVSVTISAQDQRPVEDSIVPLGTPRSLDESDFNATAFEYLIGTGISPKVFRRDYPRDRVPDQSSVLWETNILLPTTNMVGFALGLANYSLPDLQDPATLHEVFSNAHKMLFSAAIPAILSTTDGTTQIRPGTIQHVAFGIVVSRPIAITLEVLLILVGILAGAILALGSRSHSNLVKNPRGIGSLLAIFGQSGALLESYASMDRYSDTEMRQSEHGKNYTLVRRGSAGESGLRIELSAQERVKPRKPRIPSERDGCSDQHRALRPLSGAAFVGVLVAGMGILIYLKQQELRLGGLPRPSENFEILQLLENYVPTVFATLVEPFLVLLNRLRCVLQPFHDLRRGNKSAKKTFETTYGTIPPQFSIWNALKSGHFMLASLCAASLLANVFAVSLGALFNELPITANYPIAMLQTKLPVLGSEVFTDTIEGPYDHFYVTMANLSSGIQLPPWTDSKFAYVPFTERSQDAGNGTWTYRARTKGFGVEAFCSPLSTSPDSLPFANYTLDDEGNQELLVSYSTGNGTIVRCSPVKGLSTGPARNTNETKIGAYLAQEVAASLEAQTVPLKDNNGYRTLDDAGMCDRKLLLSWWRVDPADRNGTLSALHVQCVPVFRTAVFDIVVDSAGYVLESTRVGDFENTTGSVENQTNGLLDKGVEVIGRGALRAGDTVSLISLNDEWHNDTLTRDWMNYLLKIAMNSTRLVDPGQPVPDAESTTPVIEDLIQRFFSNIFGHAPGIFKTATAPVTVMGTKMVPETRIFMDQTAFVITITILTLNIVVATALYIQERNPFLPRLPMTIGSILAYVAASVAVREYTEPGEIKRKIDPWRPRVSAYGFGKYAGVDGKEHVGIEAHPFVVPLDWARMTGMGSEFSWRNWHRRFSRFAKSSASGKGTK